MSRVMCHVSRVTCHVSHVIFLFYGQRGEAYRWRVCYQRGLPRLVYLVDLGKTRGCSINTVVIHYLSYSFSPTALRHRQVQTIRDGASSQKVDYVAQVRDILNLKGH